jgi:3,4-dihydroxy-9,10-secoandrosta-1,3,5(10)-triene-9,17-dione 4,5-dioxygenase
MTGLISSLGYLRIASADPAAWREFGTKVLGLTEGRGPDPDAVYLRMDDFPARLIIVPGDAERLLATGWEVAGDQDLAEVERALAAAGAPVRTASEAELADRRVGRLLHAGDPSGNALEIFSGAALDCLRHRQPGPRPRRAAGGRRRGDAGVLHRPARLPAP